MHKVTDEQVEFILDDIKANGVTIDDLQYNLLDHICCIIENEKPEGEDFYKFYEHILPRFFNKELKEIQEETNLLLKFKHYYAMKKTLKITGLGSSIFMLLGALFKVMHWPGAGVMIVLGAASFSLIFLPLMIILKFRDEEKSTDKLIFAFSFLLAITAVMGSLFKVMHWPYANILMIGSSSVFIFAYIPLYFISRYRRAEHRFNTIINSVLMLGFGCMVFALMNLSGSKSYNDSIDASYNFMNNNSKKLVKANQKLLKSGNVSVEDVISKESERLFNHIENTKAYLISIVNQIPMEKAKGLAISDIMRPNAYLSIKDKFEKGEGEYSLKTLKDKIGTYNNLVYKYQPNDEEKLIAIDELQLERTVLSMLLFELSQIQLQIATNQHGVLNQLAAK